MKHSVIHGSLFGFALLHLSSPVLAEGLEVNLGSHTHGTSSFDIALEKHELTVLLSGPAANFVGFEHAPENHYQWRLVKTAHEDLQNGIVTLPTNAACHLESVKVEMPESMHYNDHQDEHHGEHDDHHNEHEEHHGEHHDHHGKHEEHHDDHDHDESTHSDISASYVYHCDQPAKLTQVDITVFELFEHTSTLAYQGIIGSKQVGGKLDATTTQIKLR